MYLNLPGPQQQQAHTAAEHRVQQMLTAPMASNYCMECSCWHQNFVFVLPASCLPVSQWSHTHVKPIMCNPALLLAGTLFASTRHTIAFSPGNQGWVINEGDWPGQLLSFLVDSDGQHWRGIRVRWITAPWFFSLHIRRATKCICCGRKVWNFAWHVAASATFVISSPVQADILMVAAAQR
jgi:hypothetical protein